MIQNIFNHSNLGHHIYHMTISLQQCLFTEDLATASLDLNLLGMSGREWHVSWVLGMSGREWHALWMTTILKISHYKKSQFNYPSYQSYQWLLTSKHKAIQHDTKYIENLSLIMLISHILFNIIKYIDHLMMSKELQFTVQGCVP